MPVFINDDHKDHLINIELLKAQGESILLILEHENHELSVLLADDKSIQALNKQYRGIDQATDVLSFSQNKKEEKELSSHLMGDVVISMVTAKRQASEHGLTLEEEVVLLLIHGTLHLLGFDHERSGEEAYQMKKRHKSYLVEYSQIRNPISHVVCIQTKIGLIAYEENLGALAHGIHYPR